MEGNREGFGVEQHFFQGGSGLVQECVLLACVVLKASNYRSILNLPPYDVHHIVKVDKKWNSGAMFCSLVLVTGLVLLVPCHGLNVMVCG